MTRFVMRMKVNDIWTYVVENNEPCSDVLDALKFRDMEDLVMFAIEHNIPKGTIVEEVNFSYVSESI